MAFVKRSGVQHIESHILEAIKQQKRVRIAVGIDHNGTSQEGLEELLACCHAPGEIWINHCNEPYVTFHPKVYLFENDSDAIAIIGSHNLTEGGLYTNDEASAIHWLDLKDDEDTKLLQELSAYFDIWCNPESENSKKLDIELLQKLLENEEVVPESLSSREGQASTFSKPPKETRKRPSIFAKSEIKRSAPKRNLSKTKTADSTITKVTAEAEPDTTLHEEK